jgi:hypothetical protein
MTKSHLLVGAMVLAVTILLFFVLIGPGATPLSQTPALSGTPEPGKAASSLAGASARNSADSKPTEALPVSTSRSESSALPSLADGEALRDAKEQAIWDAAYTFSPEGLKVLAPYLDDPDPIIRETAVDGIQQLASVEGIAILEAAVPRARSEKERKRLLEVAAWLALPEQGGRAARESK